MMKLKQKRSIREILKTGNNGVAEDYPDNQNDRSKSDSHFSVCLKCSKLPSLGEMVQVWDLAWFQIWFALARFLGGPSACRNPPYWGSRDNRCLRSWNVGWTCLYYTHENAPNGASVCQFLDWHRVGSIWHSCALRWLVTSFMLLIAVSPITQPPRMTRAMRKNLISTRI